MIYIVSAVGVLAYIGIAIVVYTILVERFFEDNTDAVMFGVFWPVLVALSPILFIGWLVVQGASIFQEGFARWLNKPKAVKIPKATARKAS